MADGEKHVLPGEANTAQPSTMMVVQPGQANMAQPAPGVVGQQWMVRPQPVVGCPPGLEYLSQIDQLLIHQQVEILEALTDWECKNRYQIKNTLGQQVYFAHEESDTCERICCKQGRGFTMHITDNLNQEVIRIVRPFKCWAGCCWCANTDCCAMEIEIQAPVGVTCGYVRQTQSGWVMKYDIMDAQMQPVLHIVGPCCICDGPCCPGDQEFKIHTLEGANEIGSISKQYSGFVKEMFTKADNFGVSFPVDLDVRTKATVIGGMFLIDFMFFEQSNN